MKDVFDMLEADHKKVSEIFKKLDQTTHRASKTRADLFLALSGELELHTEMEEEVFYPALESKEETQALTLEALEEHKVVKGLLEELEEMAPDSEEWMAKLTVLKENVEHHVEEEEEELFPKAREVLSESEIEEISEQIAERRKQSAASAGAGASS